MVIRLTGWDEITVDGTAYGHGVILTAGHVAKRDKAASKPFKAQYGHTPLTLGEVIPWGGRTLVVGTGHDGALPIAPEVAAEAERRGVTLRVMRTSEACELLSTLATEEVFAVLHATC